jgi:hypothetical protein
VTGEPLHSSQVLLHEPVASDGTAGAWDPQAAMRATVRAQDAPYTQRQSFHLADLGAFTFLAQASAPLAWELAGGVLTAPGGDRAYAAFGDPTWNHLVVQARFDRQGSTAGVAIGVSGSSPVAQALLAVVEDGALALIRREGGTDTVLKSLPLDATDGPLDLEVTAFDDRIRAQVGQVTVEADRGPVREGRVALMSDGTASFSRLAVDGLDLYQVPFTTSRYGSFAEHIAAMEPNVAACPADGMGAPPARTAAEILSGDGAAIAAAMGAAADPQARDALFTTILSDLGLPQLHQCDRVTLTRLDDQGLTAAILLESPEPVSFIHDVTLTLIHKVRRLIPPPVIIPPGELAAALLPPSRVPPAQTAASPVVSPPVVRPPLPSVIGSGTWVEEDIIVAATLASNGDETSTLIIPAAPLPGGNYTLTLNLKRSRWDTTTGDPQATYQDAAVIPLAW